MNTKLLSLQEANDSWSDKIMAEFKIDTNKTKIQNRRSQHFAQIMKLCSPQLERPTHNVDMKYFLSAKKVEIFHPK